MLETGPGRELYWHYVTVSSCTVASGRDPGLLVHGGFYNHCLSRQACQGVVVGERVWGEGDGWVG